MLYPRRGTTITATNYQVNLLDPGDLYSPGYWIADLKIAKNIRFSGKRLNVGVDIYNLFNTDVVRDYQEHLPGVGDWCRLGHADGPAEPALRAAVGAVRLLEQMRTEGPESSPFATRL